MPVDVISADALKEVSTPDLDDRLQAAVPSFNVARLPLSDGAIFNRPATLRGLSPDETLVLINGKRRHRSAYIDVTAQGAQAVDLAEIPLSAIDRIEVLRDGASAQYGSDAIAGVINIILKGRPGFEGYTQVGQYYAGDGANYLIGANQGIALGDRGSREPHVPRVRARRVLPLAGRRPRRRDRRSVARRRGAFFDRVLESLLRVLREPHPGAHDDAADRRHVQDRGGHRALPRAPGPLRRRGDAHPPQGWTTTSPLAYGRPSQLPWRRRSPRWPFQANRRFWELDDQIYGGISWTDHPITQIWYPTQGIHAQKGILVGAYMLAGRESFGPKSLEERRELALQGGELLHPDYRKYLGHGVSIGWRNVKHTSGATTRWSDEARKNEYPVLLEPEGPYHFAGEYLSYVNGWQEGAVRSAHHAVGKLTERVQQLTASRNGRENP